MLFDTLISILLHNKLIHLFAFILKLNILSKFKDNFNQTYYKNLMKKFLILKAVRFIYELKDQTYINKKNYEYVRFTKKNFNS